MANIYEGTLELIGHTPLVELNTSRRSLALRQDFLQSWSTLTRQDLLRTVLQKR